MTHTTCLAALTSLLALGATQVQADQTNLVQEVNFQLAGLSQGSTSSNRLSVITSTEVATLGTRQVIGAIGTALGALTQEPPSWWLSRRWAGEPLPFKSGMAATRWMFPASSRMSSGAER